MAVPRKKVTRSRRGHRRAHQRLKPVNAVACPHCGSYRRPHHVCGSCGHYRGRDFVDDTPSARD
ncbi:MAG: 50S ribosomal protein L32 [Rhodospirillales bacterium]|nr:50S ribosomal protein L32 [Rhodospirillales bacterium]MCY3857125.1 50S ribosomal protein L32 [Rhodospirillales bacterium]MCY4003512.1 50S ribosomal protein L32 [Rhodospirillales bacterium]MCY4099114.1 50S ribosomal protein L32 [Rhodospirillales bacterium]MXX23141.1 50S ribosomal protein L32 [Rhodospirillales bacterium]